MKNLLDQANQISKSMLSRQIAEMEVYRIPRYLFMMIRNICFYAVKFLSLFVKKWKTKADSMGRLTFESQLRKAEHDVLKNGACFEDSLQKNIRYHVKNSLFCLISKKAGADEVSAKVTKSASHIVHKKDLAGKSVYEINDLIYRRYAEKKKHEYREYLIIWLFLAVLVLISGAYAVICMHAPLKPVLGVAVILELADDILTARILSIWHMARFVWIVKSEGSSNAERYEYPVSSLHTDELHLMDLRMRTLHTLIYSANVLLQEQRTLENEIESGQKQMAKNLENIRLLKKERTNENERMIYSMQEENVHLRNGIVENQKKIAGRKKEYEHTESLILVLKEWLIPRFYEAWNCSYRHLQISKKALDDVICFFSMGDMKGIEKRFYEIDHTSDPKAIANRKNGIYRLELLTAQGGMAYITFDAAGQNGLFCIQNVSREEKLAEPFVTNEELAEVISGLKGKQSGDETYKKQMEELQKWYQAESRKWESQKKQLEEKNKSLSNEKQKLADEIGNQQVQIHKLSDVISQKTEDCKKLKDLLDQYTRKGDTAKAEKLSKALNQYKRQLADLQKEYDKKMSEIGDLYARISSLREKQKEIRQDLDRKQKELSQAKEQITRYHSIMEQKETEIASLADQIQDRDNQIVTLNGLLKKAESAPGVNQETVRKLEHSKKKLEDDKKKFAAEIQDQNAKIKHLRMEKEKAERMLESQKMEIAKLLQEMESSSSKILYNEEIYEELYAWIQSAQKYLYIISPFVKYHQFTVMKGKLKDAVRSHPDLKIKILYGMKDTNSRGRLHNPESIVESREFMKQLRELLGDALQVRETNTHDKLVIADDQKFMLGSANVMSFTGDYAHKKGLHSEIVICSENRKQLMELKERFFQWQ